MKEKNTFAHQQAFPLYTPADFCLIRTPTLSADIFRSLSMTTTFSLKDSQAEINRKLQAQSTHCYQRLKDLADLPQIKLALAIASSSLSESLERIYSDDQKASQVQRIYSGLLRYVIRMSTRPTPFGLFSGVALGTFANETDIQLAHPPVLKLRARPDMDWIFSFLEKVNNDPYLVNQINVYTNQTVYLVGERVVLPYTTVHSDQDNHSISLRATPVVRKILELARQPVLYANLHTTLLQLFPRATSQQVDQLLWQLWENHFLISDLHPPLTSVDPISYIYKKLASIKGIEDILQDLEHILSRIFAIDSTGVNTSVSYIHNLVHTQKKFVANDRPQPPLQVDTALHLKSPCLNIDIGKMAAQAAEFLLSQTSFPTGALHLQEYRMHFQEKYGEYAEVPVLELLSPEYGLDAPPGYSQPPKTYQRSANLQPPDNHIREQVLQTIVAEALNNHAIEYELTETIWEPLVRWSPNIEQAPLSLDIYLQIQAKSREDLDRGEYRAVIGQNCGVVTGGRTFGRFLDLLDEQGLKSLQHFIEQEERLLPDAVFAELSYQHRTARTGNVALHPALRSYEIVVGVTPTVSSEYVIALDDLVVGIQNGHFYLRSKRLGKQVIVCQNHMLTLQKSPNICRFIAEIARDGQPALVPFDWGKTSDSPFLPRLIVKSTFASSLVLSPAQWNIDRDTITSIGEGNDDIRWFLGLQDWRAKWRVPRYVYFTIADNRLLLDLEQPLMVKELHREVTKLHRRKKINLQELLPDFEHLWMCDEQGAGYFTEVVAPLLRTDAVHPEARVENNPVQPLSFTRIVPQKDRCAFPGDSWIYLKLYAPLEQHNAIIASPLLKVVQNLLQQELIDQWFFIRYGDPEPHLRLRFHANTDKQIQPVLATLLQWSHQLVERAIAQHYAIDTYEREVARYGGPAAIGLLEQVFSIDSSIISAIIAAQYANRLTLDPIAVGVFTLEHFFTSWGYDFNQRLQWLQDKTDKYAFSKDFRPQRKTYCELLSPWREKADSDLMSQRELLLALVKPGEIPLRTLGAQVRQLAEDGNLWVQEDMLLASLAHMHKIRLLDLDRQKELQIYAFWRHTLESLERRPKP